MIDCNENSSYIKVCICCVKQYAIKIVGMSHILRCNSTQLFLLTDNFHSFSTLCCNRLTSA